MRFTKDWCRYANKQSNSQAKTFLTSVIEVKHQICLLINELVRLESEYRDNEISIVKKCIPMIKI